MKKRKWSEWLFDIWCIVSLIGIWPRYIEPRLLKISYLTLPIANLPKELMGLKILHFSDLHWSDRFLPSMREKMIRKINALEPDLILFTGDWICCSNLQKPKELESFLNALKAKMGYFAILGNHDYANFVTVNSKGEFDIKHPSSSSIIEQGFKKLFRPLSVVQKVTLEARQVGLHLELIELLKNTPFQLLKNETTFIPCLESGINVSGLEEYSLGRSHPKIAFQNYREGFPGIVLSHHPDMVEMLKEYPGDIILCGHTHGGQVNLPFLWKRLTRIRSLQFKSGLRRVKDKWVYINRGISSVMQFRWFASPELTLITLKR